MTSLFIESSTLRTALEEASNPEGFLSMHQFVDLVLYHESEGYYRQNRQRVGRDRNSDFYTSSSFRETFGDALIEAACGALKLRNFRPEETTWVEVGAEPDLALLDARDTPFADALAIGSSDSLELGGQLVVFSNELFDAQPFHTVIFSEGSWKERGVSLAEGVPSFTLGPIEGGQLEPLLADLPDVHLEGYTIDLPTGAQSIARKIASQDWQGLFLALDYGKTWQSLVTESPQGSARAYLNHEQSRDLLAHAGQQDLTHHICWNWIEDALSVSGFSDIYLQSQEAFIIKGAPQLMRDAMSQGPLSKTLSQLKHLIHPSLMGQAFQSLTAFRMEAS